MLFSYRHPDQVAKEASRAKLSAHEAAALVERRRVVREIPTPAAVEHSDDEVWALWDSVTGCGELSAEQLQGKFMANWERKNADILADAISKHIKSHPDMVEDNALLAIIQETIDDAANTVMTTQAELNRCRAVVCAICRGSKLYECDVPVGWSSNCAFIFDNTTEFAGL